MNQFFNFHFNLNDGQATLSRIFPIVFDTPCTCKRCFQFRLLKCLFQSLSGTTFRTLGKRTTNEKVTLYIIALKPIEVFLMVNQVKFFLQGRNISQSFSARMFCAIQHESTTDNLLFPIGQALCSLLLELTCTMLIVLCVVTAVSHALDILFKQVFTHRRKTCIDINEIVLSSLNAANNLILYLSCFVVVQSEGHQYGETIRMG